ncbi:ROK family transcriptional regulator [Nocardioides ferulae]|uniref:ROK family transcriptional regulator n=1 Tax=Nocardioides ferulae TaxID=2340821 RepID=UPI000EB436E9|nr:ROK family protein [Nocardioides ferulae]
MGRIQGSGSLREANTRLVVEQLRHSGPTTRPALARSTGLAKQTVSTIVARLMTDGIAREAGIQPAERSGGRPAVLVEYAADRAYVAGLEIGVGRTRIMLADLLGNAVVVQEVHPEGRSARRPAEKLVAGLVGELERLLAERGGLERLHAVGVSVTGLVHPASGSCVLAPNLGWRDVPVAGLVSAAIGSDAQVPVIVRGAAQASLIAEHREGAAVGEPDVVLVFEDEGVGAAVVEADHLVEGVDGTAGELGHCAWPGAERRCGCGRRGCVETLTSGPAVRREIEARTGRRLPRRPGTPTYALLAEQADEPAVAEAVRDAGRVLGTAVSWVTAITAPRLVVLSGSLIAAPDQLRAGIVASLRQRALHGGPARVVPGALGADAALRGVVLLALDRARESTAR